MRLPSWVRLPGRTVRVRLTVLYALLFLFSGALLLAIASGVAVGRSSVTAAAVNPNAGSYPQQPGQASARIHMLQSEVARLQSQVAHLQSEVPSQPGQNQLAHDLFISSLIALAIMTIVSAALGWLVAGRALRPVRQMTAAAQRISEDNLHERLAVTGPRDELKELGDTIDGLLARLEGAFAAQRRFVANASHELRTPLTTMRAALDVAVAKPEPAPPQTVALAARLRAELDRVDALLEAFLVLARAQHGNLPGWTALPLDYLVGAALADQATAIGARNLTVQDTSGPGGAWVTGSEALLSRLVENVIGNAVYHNADGGWIRITTQTDGSRASLVVENGGQVLEQQEVAELAQPFRRLGADRTGSDEGSGLGLSIVAAIAEAHGGTLDLQARDGGGLRVRVELPSADARPPTAEGESG
jgi:signal transduction histidine kinase